VLDFSSRGVATVGAVPGGLPRPSIPDVSASEYRDLLVNGAAIALVGLAESLSAARLFAVRNGYRIRADREFIATGTANLAAAVSGGFGVGGSLSKTAIAEQSGGTSRLTGFTTAGIILVVLLFFTSQLDELPLAILSAVVIQAVWGLMDIKALARYYRVRRNDFVAAVAALVGVLIFGTLPGVLLAVALSVLGLVYRSGRLDVDALGKVKGEKAAWGSLARDPTHERIEGILVLRLSAPLFWVNAAGATVLIVDHLENNPGTHSVILDLEATGQLDITAADELGSLIRRLRRRGVDLYLVRVMHPARAVLASAGVLTELGPDHMWRTISQGVRAARRAAADPSREPNAAAADTAVVEVTVAATDAAVAEVPADAAVTDATEGIPAGAHRVEAPLAEPTDS
jgi:MFS superfamily sulfate permease-like transporter